jgi:F1F0 ATPase subunit 2
MIDWQKGIGLLAGGFGLGLLFYGGLWLTVRHLPTMRRPALLFTVSLLARTTLAVIGLYAITGGYWLGLLVALAGFVLARPIVIRLTRVRPDPGGKDVTP